LGEKVFTSLLTYDLLFCFQKILTRPWNPWVLSNEVREIPISTQISVDLWGEDINTELSENISKRDIEIYPYETAENKRNIKVFCGP